MGLPTLARSVETSQSESARLYLGAIDLLLWYRMWLGLNLRRDLTSTICPRPLLREARLACGSHHRVMWSLGSDRLLWAGLRSYGTDLRANLRADLWLRVGRGLLQLWTGRQRLGLRGYHLRQGKWLGRGFRHLSQG